MIQKGKRVFDERLGCGKADAEGIRVICLPVNDAGRVVS